MNRKDRTLLAALILFIIVLMMLGLSSCGPAHYLRKADRALKKAEQLGADITSDTIYLEKQIFIPQVKTDTVFSSIEGDTVFLEKDKLKIKYVNLPAHSVYISGECESDTVRIEVPVKVFREISAGYTLWELIILAIAALAVGYIVRVFVQMVRE